MGAVSRHHLHPVDFLTSDEISPCELEFDGPVDRAQCPRICRNPSHTDPRCVEPAFVVDKACFDSPVFDDPAGMGHVSDMAYDRQFCRIVATDLEFEAVPLCRHVDPITDFWRT